MIVFQNFKGHEKDKLRLIGSDHDADMFWESYYEERDILLALEVTLSDKISVNLLHPLALEGNVIENFLSTLKNVLEMLMNGSIKYLQDILIYKHDQTE